MIFSIPGFGTVVTGTLLNGSLNQGNEIEILPARHKGRIRGLQTHKKKEEFASPGSRTAVNVSGINVDDIRRGDVLAYPDQYQSTRRIDVSFRLLPDVTLPIKHNMNVKLFIGAAESLARVRVLGTDAIQPGEEGWLQIEMEEPMVAVRKDRYIIRRPSPGETLGGGEVLDPHPARRHKRFSKEVLSRLVLYRQGTPEDLLLQASSRLGIALGKDLFPQSGLSEVQYQQSLKALVENGKLVSLSKPSAAVQDQIIISQQQWEKDKRQVTDLLQEYHHRFPLRRGMPREEIKSRMKKTARMFNAQMDTWRESGVLV